MWVYIHKMAPQSAIDIALKGIREKKAMEMQKAKSRTIKDWKRCHYCFFFLADEK